MQQSKCLNVRIPQGDRMRIIIESVFALRDSGVKGWRPARCYMRVSYSLEGQPGCLLAHAIY